MPERVEGVKVAIDESGLGRRNTATRTCGTVELDGGRTFSESGRCAD